MKRNKWTGEVEYIPLKTLIEKDEIDYVIAFGTGLVFVIVGAIIIFYFHFSI